MFPEVMTADDGPRRAVLTAVDGSRWRSDVAASPTPLKSDFITAAWGGFISAVPLRIRWWNKSAYRHRGYDYADEAAL